MKGREGAQKMVNVLGEVIGSTVIVGDDWPAGRNLKGDGPGVRWLVDLWEKVKV